MLACTHDSQEPWGELDVEAAARQFAGVAVEHACLPERMYGRVYYNAQIHESEDFFRIVLRPPEIGQSYRFSRVYGSEAIVRLNARPKSADPKKKCH